MTLDMQVAQSVEIVVTAEEINHAHEKCLEGQKNAVEWAIRCGELLIAKKESMEYGDWGGWVQENCHFTRMTANNYIRVAEGVVKRALQPTKSAQPRLEDAPSVRAALRQISAEEPKPTPPPAPRKEIAFSWFKQAAVLAIDEAKTVIREGIKLLAGATRDKLVAKDILLNLGKELLKMGEMAIRRAEQL